jgi:hypothetical protein
MSLRRCLFWTLVGYLLARGAVIIKPRETLAAAADAIDAVVTAWDRGTEGQRDGGSRERPPPP